MAYDDRELTRRLHEAAEAIVVPDRPLKPRSRAMPVLIGAVATALVLILAVAIGNYLGERRDPSGVLVYPTPTTSASPSGPASASPSATPTAAATSDPTLAKYIQPLVQTWRPSTTTVILLERRQSGRAPNEITLVAVPADGSAVTRLVRITDSGLAAMSRDGSSLVVSIVVSFEESRLALWDLRTGVTRWLTPAESNVQTGNPVWAPDGTTVYYGKYRTSQPRGASPTEDLGLFRIGRDGTGETRVRGPVSPPSISIPVQATDDGLLVWGPAYEGVGLMVFDTRSGRDHSYGAIVATASVRPDQPRFLVMEGGGTGCCRGVTLWDHATGSKRQITSERVLGVDWGTDGRSLVLATAASPTGGFRLVTYVDAGSPGTTVAGSDDGVWPLWLRAGIAYLYAPVSADGIPRDVSELRIISPSGGTARTLYRAAVGNILFQNGFVSP